MKKNDYLCPKCKGHLNVGDHVVFTTKNNRKKKGVILLSPDVGSYSYIHHSAYGFQDGELVEFSCPICQKDLQASSNPDFVSIIMVDHNLLILSMRLWNTFKPRWGPVFLTCSKSLRPWCDFPKRLSMCPQRAVRSCRVHIPTQW